MTKIQMPYQCLDVAGDVLIAARGSSIYCFSLENYSLLSIWKSGISAEPATPPTTKRRKLSHTGDSQEPNTRDGKKKTNSRLEAVASGLESPAVIALAVTKSGNHVVAVTGEDKSIRVFESAFEEGRKHRLQQISRRQANPT
jgi:tRNA (guanine-N(7)-)-methyltransferase subunit TRM82